MKYKIITTIIKEVPVKTRLKKLDVSILQLGIMAGVDKATMHFALNNKLILIEKTAQKIITALEKLETSPDLVEEKKNITKGVGRKSVINEKEKQQMIELRKQGKTLQEIGDMFYGLTKERVRQLVNISYVELRRMGVKTKFGRKKKV